MTDVERIPSVSPGWAVKPRPERKGRPQSGKEGKENKDKRRRKPDPDNKISIDEYA